MYPYNGGGGYGYNGYTPHPPQAGGGYYQGQGDQYGGLPPPPGQG